MFVSFSSSVAFCGLKHNLKYLGIVPCGATADTPTTHFPAKKSKLHSTSKSKILVLTQDTHTNTHQHNENSCKRKQARSKERIDLFHKNTHYHYHRSHVLIQTPITPSSPLQPNRSYTSSTPYTLCPIPFMPFGYYISDDIVFVVPITLAVLTAKSFPS